MPKIKGIQKTTFIDYPGKIAATLFTGGCNFRCSYCHNSALVKAAEALPDIPAVEILEYLKGRTEQLEGICITGGEPTIHSDLPEFISKIKAMGYAVKLDTNGTNPEMLEDLIQQKLIDYIAMDIKGPIEIYPEIVNTPIDQEKIQQSINLILKSGINHEFRTTVLPCYHREKEMQEIGELIKGAQAYYLQQFRANEHLIDGSLSQEKVYSSGELQDLAGKFKNITSLVKVRGAA